MKYTSTVVGTSSDACGGETIQGIETHIIRSGHGQACEQCVRLKHAKPPTSLLFHSGDLSPYRHTYHANCTHPKFRDVLNALDLTPTRCLFFRIDTHGQTSLKRTASTTQCQKNVQFAYLAPPRLMRLYENSTVTTCLVDINGEGALRQGGCLHCGYPGEDAVGQADDGLFGGYEGSDVCEIYSHSNLPKESGPTHCIDLMGMINARS